MASPPPKREASDIKLTLLVAAALPQKEQHDSDDVAKERSSPTIAYDILLPFIETHVIYSSRKKLSSYAPSSLMMDYIVHQINYKLVDNFRFKRSTPDYHPYIIRLYYAVIFWIQCLRANHEVGLLDNSKHQFLVRFLDVHPLQSLPIAGPLIPLFQTLCSSQPEIPTYGKVHPYLPEKVGPDRRRHFIRDTLNAFLLPNVPGIFALLEHLDSVINAEQPHYPKKGSHVPVSSTANQATIFGHHSFPAANKRSDMENWALCSSGLQYPCEADAKLNEALSERCSSFDFPPTAANENLTKMDNFLTMDTSLAWFSQVKNVAAAAVAHFQDSGTLADCKAFGISANQIQVLLQKTAQVLPAPTCSADKRSLCPFAFRLRTSARNLPPLAEAMAAMAQTNIVMPVNHPYLTGFGTTTLQGEFWDIRPLEHSAMTHPTLPSMILSRR